MLNQNYTFPKIWNILCLFYEIKNKKKTVFKTNYY